MKEFRNEKKLKQKDIALILETSQSTISKIETGRISPSIKIAFKIANTLNVTVEELFVSEKTR